MSLSTHLTYPGIGLAVFAQQLNLPFPAILLLITIGALASQGQEHLHIPLVLLSGVIGCLAADGCWFWLGRRWGSGVIRLVCSLTSNPQQTRERSHQIFSKWGLRMLLVAKFVPGLDGVAPPLAAAEGAGVLEFLAYDSVGSFVWTATFVAVGFLFSNQVDSIMKLFGRFEATLAIAVGAPLILYVSWRAARVWRMIRHLRLRRISPAMLQRKLEESNKVMIVDLLDYEAQDGKIKAIPGAFRADPLRLRSVRKLVVPEGVDVVLYCSAKNEFVSARVAEALQKRGVQDVWVLEGGLEAWMLDGRSVTAELAKGEEVAARVGIVLPPELQ